MKKKTKKAAEFSFIINDDGSTDSFINWDLNKLGDSMKMEILEKFAKGLACFQRSELVQLVRYDISQKGIISKDENIALLLLQKMDEYMATIMEKQMKELGEQMNQATKDEPIFSPLEALDFRGMH